MRALRRPPSPPKEPPSQSDVLVRNNAQSRNSSRGRRDAPADESNYHLSHRGRSNSNSTGHEGTFDGQYSSDENEASILVGNTKRGDQIRRMTREPPEYSDVEGWRKHTSRKEMQVAASVQRLDPPDEVVNSHGIDNNRELRNQSVQGCIGYDYHLQHKVDRAATYHDASWKSTRTENHSSSRDYRSTNHSENKGFHPKRVSANDYPLFDEEEDLYEQYQDDIFHNQPLVQQQPISSQFGQFNIAPLVEMSPLHGTQSKKQTHRQNSKKHHHLYDKEWQSRPSTGRYSQHERHEHKGDVEQEIDDVLDNISLNRKDRKIHEESDNFNDEQEDASDDDDDDDDEERPLRKSSSASSLYIRRSTRPTVFSRTETCLNRTLAFVIAFLSLVFIRDHTSWWKKYQSRVAMEKYENEMISDPMKVYNTNDDDSSHARDHDPLNLYNEITAGKRISDRPAEKSLHHGFMDGNYENRPAGKNSGLATAKEAGVKDKNKDQDQETAAFLASVTHSSGTSNRSSSTDKIESSKNTQEKARQQNEPSKNSLDNLDSEGSTYSNGESAKTIASASASLVDMDWSDAHEAKQKDTVSASSASFVSSSTPYTAGRDKTTTMYDSQSKVDSHYYLGDSPGNKGDVSSETIGQKSHMNAVSYENTSTTGVDEGMNLDGVDPKARVSANSRESGSSSGFISKSVSGGEGFSHETDSSIEGGTHSGLIDPEELYLEQSAQSQIQIHKSTPEVHTSSIESLSAFDQSMTTRDVKSVYKDTFYRWNHPFRHDETSELNGGIDVPVFWRIPRAASGVMEATMSYCYGLTLASALGAGFEDETLRKIKVPAGAMFVNVDVSTPAGIQRAVEMNLGSSRVADVISSPFIYETTSIFQGIPESGKCFTLLRHPVDRAVSQYHFYQTEESSTNPNTAQYEGMTIDEYATAVGENNWMVRFLTNKRAGALNWHDLEAAKEGRVVYVNARVQFTQTPLMIQSSTPNEPVFGRKCLVGLVDKAEESIRRYERFFHWDKRISDRSQKEDCLKTTLSKHDKRQDHPRYEGTEAWELLRKKNEYDVLLYEYAENLYSQQSVLFENFD